MGVETPDPAGERTGLAGVRHRTTQPCDLLAREALDLLEVARRSGEDEYLVPAGNLSRLRASLPHQTGETGATG